MTEGQSGAELLDRLLSEIDDASSPEDELEGGALFHARCELITLRQQVVINPKAKIREEVETIRSRVSAVSQAGNRCLVAPLTTCHLETAVESVVL